MSYPPRSSAVSNLKSDISNPPSTIHRPPTLRVLRVLCGESFLFFIVWVFLLFIGRSAMLRDPGSFWHVAAGQRMLFAGQILRSDPFSFTRARRPWVADQWLAECGMAAVHRLAGWDGLLLTTATILAAIYAWIAARLLRGGLHWLPTGLLLALTVLVGSPQFFVRPLVLTIGLLAVTFAWLIDVEAGRKRLRQLWWLVPLFVLWANLHGGVLAGMGTVGLCAAGWCVVAWLGAMATLAWPCPAADPCSREREHGTVRKTAELAALVAALLATAIINPYGFALPQEWLETLAMPLPQLLQEHAPLSLAEPIGWATLLLAVGYTAVLIGTRPQRLRITWLLPLVWFVLAIMRVRNAPLFGVTAGIALADMLPYSQAGKWLERRRMLGSPRPTAGWRPLVLPVVVVAAALAIQVADVHLPLVGRGWARFDPTRWPVELLPALREIGATNAEGTPIFNDLNYGGFVIYHAPRLRVFVDDRCSLYGEGFLRAYDHARREEPARIEQWRRQYKFRYALVKTGGEFDRYLAARAEWSSLAHASAATLYECHLGDSEAPR